MKRYKTRLEDGQAVLVADGEAVCAGLLSGPDEVEDFLRAIGLNKETEEVAVMIGLNTKNKAIGYCEISRGSARETFMDARIVYRNALLMNATQVIVAHNHPSGYSNPSLPDREAMKTLKDAGNLLCCPLLDFVILGDDCWSACRYGWE